MESQLALEGFQVWNEASGMRVGYDAFASLECSIQSWTHVTKLDPRDKVGPT